MELDFLNYRFRLLLQVSDQFWVVSYISLTYLMTVCIPIVIKLLCITGKYVGENNGDS